MGTELDKKCFIIAGPNGAGKTTFAKDFLPKEGDCINYINADLIASGLSPFAPEKVSIMAGKLNFSLPSVEMAVDRVRYRVEQGGHNIPERDIRRRFERSQVNLESVFKPIVDAWVVFDTSSSRPRLIGESSDEK